MGRYVNPGTEAFEVSLRSDYVDKTGLVGYTNSILGKQSRYVCVSRPRRFGKTMAADMLLAYYGRGCDSAPLFEGLAASGLPSFAEHLNRYDAVRLNVIEFILGSDGMADMLAYMAESVADDLAALYPDVRPPRRPTLPNILAAYHAATGNRFVIVIDEWDCVFRRREFTAEDQALYLDWLRDLLKDRTYVALAYMTGILPIKKYGEHSALNMFWEKSIVNADPIQEFTGFTEGEVERLCEAHGVDLGGVRSWYDGYEVNGMHLYAPRSVMGAMESGVLDSYWTKTETYEALARYVRMDLDGLRGKVLRLLSGERVAVNDATFSNDMYDVGTADDVLTLLVHLGYLTYSIADGECWIPNHEVRLEFESCLTQRGWEQVAAAIDASERLMAATLAADGEAVARLLSEAHRSVASALTYNSENALACAVMLAYYSARRSYRIVREQPAGVGFADIVFYPREGSPGPGVVVELKRGGTPGEALAQIRSRGYADALAGAAGEVLLVGVSYDADDPDKAHSCEIERL